MTPEQKARQQIDRQLEQAGWIVQDYRQINISAGLGVAVREFPLTTGSADYLLYADGKAIGVVEAKPKGHTLTGVETQSGKYLDGLPAGLPHHRLPLPFAYESTGEVTQFTNTLEPDARSRAVFTFHRPEELIRLAGLDKQVRTRLRELPPLNVGQLWRVQIESINNLEKSLAGNRPRALIQMATGSGKTFTAVNFCYRLIKYADARRILFLVDRNNLGKQTLNEFQQFVSPLNGYKFTEEYTVQHLKTNTVAPSSKVCITTIQRLYSMLKGEEDFQEENEDGSLFETETTLVREPLPVIYNAKIPIEAFDFIVVDECHRSIYNIWRQVLEYFDSFLIGLTATWLEIDEGAGPGHMLNPPQWLDGDDFENFKKRACGDFRFGFQRVDGDPYAQSLFELAMKFRKPRLTQDSLRFCNELVVLAEHDPDLYDDSIELRNYVKRSLARQIRKKQEPAGKPLKRAPAPKKKQSKSKSRNRKSR